MPVTKANITTAYLLLNQALDDALDTHDCHASPEDGCTCVEVGFMQQDIARIYQFIVTYNRYTDL